MAVQLDDFFAQLMGIVAPFSIGQVAQSEDGSVQIRIEVDPAIDRVGFTPFTNIRTSRGDTSM